MKLFGLVGSGNLLQDQPHFCGTLRRGVQVWRRGDTFKLIGESLERVHAELPGFLRHLEELYGMAPKVELSVFEESRN